MTIVLMKIIRCAASRRRRAAAAEAAAVMLVRISVSSFAPTAPSSRSLAARVEAAIASRRTTEEATSVRSGTNIADT